MHVICPSCDAINRIPPERLGDGPKCGACRAALFTGHPLELTTARFERHAARSDIPLLVDFWAPWCGPCRSMAPAFEAAAVELEPRFRLVKINTDAEQGLAAQYSIRSIPTLALFNKGREVARQAGAIGLAEIIRWAEQHARAA